MQHNSLSQRWRGEREVLQSCRWSAVLAVARAAGVARAVAVCDGSGVRRN
jgi:hypothetical protein